MTDKKPAVKKTPVKAEKYFEGVGRRKTSIARVRIFSKEGGMIVNDRDYKNYFPLASQQIKVYAPINALKIKDRTKVMVKVKGGGLTSQAEAIRHGLARALVILNSAFRTPLRNLGYLTRDSRMVERKKYGLKKARRAPQWQKR
ncbi:MAG: 30S ribosomal protein S9 [Candidatus Brennerbacteria bacterium]|nr:30S ribosomal protein S9 [Candidatus Brennerbacteria bacterium]